MVCELPTTGIMQVLDFVRASPALHALFTEDQGWEDRQRQDATKLGHEHNRISRMGPFWDFLHIFGAFSYVACVTGAVLWNSFDVEVAIITFLTFLFFSFLGWLTGVFDHVRIERILWRFPIAPIAVC